MTQKERITQLLADGTKRTTRTIAGALTLNEDTTRRNMNELRAAGQVALDSYSNPNTYYLVVA